MGECVRISECPVCGRMPKRSLNGSYWVIQCKPSFGKPHLKVVSPANKSSIYAVYKWNRRGKVLNYYELKKIKKNIDTQKLKVAAARDKAVSISSASDGSPHGGAVSDRVGMSVGRIIAEEEKLNELYTQLTEGIKAVPDEYIKTLIHCKLVKNWSWTRIAQEIGGNNTGNTIRMQCVRYSW